MQGLILATYVLWFSPLLGDAPATGRTLDDAFNEAIYYYACLKVDKAFKIMDEGIRTLPPTPKAHVQLKFYKDCFDLANGNWWAYDSHSAEASKLIEELKKIPNKSDTDLVRLALLIPTAGTYPCDEATAQELVKRYPSSPWAAWARWRIADSMAGRTIVKAGDPQEDDVHAHSRGYSALKAAYLADELELEMKGSPAEASIMRAYLARETCLRNMTSLERMKEQYALIAKMTKAPGAEKQETLEAAYQTWQKLRQSLVDELEEAQYNIVSGRQDVNSLWSYYEMVRKAGIRLPDCIPADRETFMKEAVTVHRYEMERKLNKDEE